jgi:hypothetical protein
VDESLGAAQEEPGPSIVAPTPTPVGPTSQTIAFGTGGTGCTVASDTRDFTPGARVRFGVTFDPPLPPGTTMRVRVTRDSALVFNFRRSVGTETTCYSGDFSTAGLQVGRYLWSLTYDGSGEPAIQVAFVLVEATPTISTSPTPAPVKPTVKAVAFGIGGSGCAVTATTGSFAPGAQIRFGVTFYPALPPSTTVHVRVSRDSELVLDLTRTVDVETACYSDEFAMARVGIYRWSVTYDGSPEPPDELVFSVLRE